MQEAMSLQWRDIDFQHQTVRVKSKPLRAFIPKAYEEREIPLEQSLGAALLLCKTRRSAKPDDLVFPTKSQRANGKMLQSLKRIAKRAGMDAEDWWLHRFRATFATFHLQAGVDLRTL
jgi:integrase